jgi:hypothetical protein
MQQMMMPNPRMNGRRSKFQDRKNNASKIVTSPQNNALKIVCQGTETMPTNCPRKIVI